MSSVHKRFGRTHALRGVDFALRPGEAHALLGENGSGKSTLMKVAYGEIMADSGEIRVRGEEVNFANPLQAARSGIAMVAQEVPVVPSLSVAENIALGGLPGSPLRVDWRGAHRVAREALAELGSKVRSHQLVGSLGPGDRQVVAIARAITSRASVVIFDEPTSSLSGELVESLFEIIRRMKERGLAIAFISQRLQDIEPVADRVTVLRDGSVVDTLGIGEADEMTITQLMVGRSLTDYFHREITAGPTTHARPVLEVRGLRVEPTAGPADLVVRPGEVVGVAGLVGSGRVEVVRAVFGADAVQGDVEVAGVPYRRRSPRGSIKRGIALVTGDRKQEGLIAGASVLQNLTTVTNSRLSLMPVPARSQRRAARAVMADLQVRPDDPDLPAGSLSGGNQQKVVIGRWLDRDLRLLLLDEPTRGVDVGAKSEIYRVIRELAAKRVGVLISSSESTELLGLCDRIVMMLHGKVVGDLPADQLDELSIAQHIAGVEHDV
ncbi:sugar ABC transporter ATP-binding protein [Nocardioides kongjuensis]|nr:sugar ABC transporter ATP-binding protein [Nocardioides kongjuensis]